jgi:hypothetical protein
MGQMSSNFIYNHPITIENICKCDQVKIVCSILFTVQPSYDKTKYLQVWTVVTSCDQVQKMSE